jgi:hypothetical protein
MIDSSDSAAVLPVRISVCASSAHRVIVFPKGANWGDADILNDVLKLPDPGAPTPCAWRQDLFSGPLSGTSYHHLSALSIHDESTLESFTPCFEYATGCWRSTSV